MTTTAPTGTSSTDTAAHRPAREPGAPDHVRLGVGARVSLHPAADDVVPVILGALQAAARVTPGLVTRTSDVSTLLRGSESDIARYVVELVQDAVSRTPSGHVVLTVALSRGCPGEVGCALPAGELVTVPPVPRVATGLSAAAHWALYPLGTLGAMAQIADAIEMAKDAGTWGGAESFATRLDGDLADVVATILDTWAAVGRTVAHVAAHATVSVGSPSASGRITATSRGAR